MKPIWMPRWGSDVLEILRHPIWSLQYYIEHWIHGPEIIRYSDRPGPTVIESAVFGELEARPVLKVEFNERSGRINRRTEGFLLTHPPEQIPLLHAMDGFIAGKTAGDARYNLNGLYHLNQDLYKTVGRNM